AAGYLPPPACVAQHTPALGLVLPGRERGPLKYHGIPADNHSNAHEAETGGDELPGLAAGGAHPGGLRCRRRRGRGPGGGPPRLLRARRGGTPAGGRGRFLARPEGLRGAE
ncbi:MAG: hypothetical protein AVDCRST_MAG25-2002, partial [uncultured Rubrobacteraceae bacterium]